MITNNKPDLIFVEPVRTGHLNEATFCMHKGYLQLIQQSNVLLIYLDKGVRQVKVMTKRFAKP